MSLDLMRQPNMPNGLSHDEVALLFDRLRSLTQKSKIQWQLLPSEFTPEAYTYNTRDNDGFRVDIGKLDTSPYVVVHTINDPRQEDRVVGRLSEDYPPQPQVHKMLASKALELIESIQV